MSPPGRFSGQAAACGNTAVSRSSARMRRICGGTRLPPRMRSSVPLELPRSILEAIAPRVIHIDARVGFEQGPQVADPAEIQRFAKLGVIASMQPNHLLTDMNWAEDRLGPKR